MASDPSLYETDILAWSGQQAALLRRLARGERVNGVDWENVIEEVESVGRSELKSVRSLLLQALLHGLKVAAWPGNEAARHWLVEAATFLSDARRRYEPGMRQRLELEDIYDEALELFDLVSGGPEPRPVHRRLPLAAEELMDRKLSAPDLVARLSAPPPPPG